MKVKLSIIIVLLSLAFYTCKKESISTSQSSSFIKYFGTSSASQGYDLKQTSDGGYIIVGTTLINGNNTDVFLVKTDANGNKQWSNHYDNANANLPDIGKSIQIAADGYIVLGTTYTVKNDSDLYLIKTNFSGNVMWSDTIGGSGSQVGNCVQIMNDGNFVVAGSTNPMGVQRNFFLAKVNKAGATQWRGTPSVSGSSSGLDNVIDYVQVVNDSTLYVMGKSKNQSGDYQVYVGVAYNNNAILPLLTLQNPFVTGFSNMTGNNECLMGCSLSDKTKLVITGYQNSNLYLANIAETESQEVSLPSAICSVTPFAISGMTGIVGNFVQTSTDGGYIIVGNYSNSSSDIDQYLLKVNSSGTKDWDLKVGGKGIDLGNAVIQTSDGGYAFTGSTALDNVTVMTLTKVSSQGKLQ